MQNDQRTMRAKTTVGSLLAGLGTLASVYPNATVLRYPHRSSTEALRGDFVRLGADMQRVIVRERARLKTLQK